MRIARPLLPVLLLAWCIPAPSSAAVSWSKVYDSATPLPGTNQTPFFLSAVAVSGQNLAFAARYTDQWGDYEGDYGLLNGTLTRVVDTSMTLPDSNGAAMNYTLYPPAIEGADLDFYAVGYRANHPAGVPAWNAGIYRYSNGSLVRVADEQINVPGASSTFYDFSRAGLRNSTVIFNGVNEDGSAAGVYTQSPGQPLHTVADLSTPVPGHSVNFYGFPYLLDHTALLPDGSAVFMGGYQAPPIGQTSGGLFGIYRTLGPSGALQAIAEDSITAIPGGAPGSVFLDVYAPVAADDGSILFSGQDPSIRGIYIFRNGQLQALVDSNTLLPDHSGTFGSFGPHPDEVTFAYSHGLLLFEGYDRVTDNNNTLNGLYRASPGGEITQLLAPGQSFDGRTISYWQFGHDSLDAAGLALSLHFTDGSSGIYTAPLPEPSSLLLLLPLALLRRR